MTPTDACLGALHPDGLTKLSTSGERLEGPAPSKTFALHRGVYECNAALNGIVHTHSRHLVALTLAGVWRPGDVVPPLTPYYVMKVVHIPLVPYYRPGDPVVAALAREYAASVRGVLIERLRSGHVGVVGFPSGLCARRTRRDRAAVARYRPDAGTARRSGARRITRNVRRPVVDASTAGGCASRSRPPSPDSRLDLDANRRPRRRSCCRARIPASSSRSTGPA